uniref:Uncharacterized protein n=1 Tax=Cacopsylla melanoneura TaxID=428564 RepID=A0A8D8TAW4_9HEMI
MSKTINSHKLRNKIPLNVVVGNPVVFNAIFWEVFQRAGNFAGKIETDNGWISRQQPRARENSDAHQGFDSSRGHWSRALPQALLAHPPLIQVEFKTSVRTFPSLLEKSW